MQCFDDQGKYEVFRFFFEREHDIKHAFCVLNANKAGLFEGSSFWGSSCPPVTLY